MLFRIACLAIILATACKQPSKPTIIARPNSDTAIIVPAMDTTIVKPHEYDRATDSIRIMQIRDSFYAQLPVLRFTDNKQGDALLKLAAWCTDTLPVRRTPLQFTEKEDRRYNREQVPVKVRYTYRHPAYIVALTDNRPEAYHPRQLTVNGKPLRPGIELDTSMVGQEWLSHLSLDVTGFSAIEINRQQWLLLEGGIEKCNGTGCGVRYFILYNPLQNRGIVVQQFRMALLIIGYNKTTRQPELVVMEDADYNDLLQYENCAGAIYAINQQGKVQAIKDQVGRPRHFEGYYPLNDRDTCGCICIRQHNMR